jgi:hypothetical protein
LESLFKIECFGSKLSKKKLWEKRNAFKQKIEGLRNSHQARRARKLGQGLHGIKV